MINNNTIYNVPKLNWENSYEGEEDCTLKLWQSECPITACYFEFFEEDGKFYESSVGCESDLEIKTQEFESFEHANRYFEGLSLCYQHVKAK